MEELGKKKENSRVYSDSQSVIHLANNSVIHSKTKHIHIRYHFICSVLENGQLKREKIHTIHNHVDMLTKVVMRRN